MEQSKTPNHSARHKTRASLLSDKGLDAANHNRASGGGRRMFLTSPLIEQAFTPTTRLLVSLCSSRAPNARRNRDVQGCGLTNSIEAQGFRWSTVSCPFR